MEIKEIRKENKGLRCRFTFWRENWSWSYFRFPFFLEMLKKGWGFGVTGWVFRHGEKTGRGAGGEVGFGSSGLAGGIVVGLIDALCCRRSSLCFARWMRMESGRSSLTKCWEPLRE